MPPRQPGRRTPHPRNQYQSQLVRSPQPMQGGPWWEPQPGAPLRKFQPPGAPNPINSYYPPPSNLSYDYTPDTMSPPTQDYLHAPGGLINGQNWQQANTYQPAWAPPARKRTNLRPRY